MFHICVSYVTLHTSTWLHIRCYFVSHFNGCFIVFDSFRLCQSYLGIFFLVARQINRFGFTLFRLSHSLPAFLKKKKRKYIEHRNFLHRWFADKLSHGTYHLSVCSFNFVDKKITALPCIMRFLLGNICFYVFFYFLLLIFDKNVSDARKRIKFP